MKLTLLFGIFIFLSCTDAWLHSKGPMTNADLWKIIHELFPPLRPTARPTHPAVITTVHPIIPSQETTIVELPQTTTTQKIPVYSTGQTVVTETVPTNPPWTSKATEPTPGGGDHQELRRQILRAVSKITDILLFLPNRVLTIVSVILPILGNLIDIISVYLKGHSS